jgi:uncharacterized protein YecT (DUF1311 family)
VGYAVIRAILAIAVGGLLWCGSAFAQKPSQAARDSATVQDCIKSKSGAEEKCISVVSEPCLKDVTGATSEMTGCVAREQVVWDDILNETFRRLRDKLDEQQKVKLRDMQRAWIASRQKTCAFYWDFFKGTMATPMSAECNNRETARRALFLLGFLLDADNK